jgi:multiple sugar transport system substrate-binding protein
VTSPLNASHISRRRVLRGGAALSAAALAARSAFAAPAKPLTFIGWQYHPEIVDQNVETFKKLYDEAVTYELVSGDYHPVVETKLTGGQHVDMMYSEEDHIARWNAADWPALLRRPQCLHLQRGASFQGRSAGSRQLGHSA